MAQIFISYAREDVAVARLVKAGLEQRGYTVSLDLDDLTRGDWASQITDKLTAAADVLVFVGPSALASRHVGDEVQQALQLGKPLVPVLMLAQTPPDLADWAAALLRNQAARYDALDLEVSLVRIERLLSCQPGQGAATAPAVEPAPPAARPRAGDAGPPTPPPKAGAARWPWLAGAGTAALALVLWFVAMRSPPEPDRPLAAAPPQALPATPPGKLAIQFKGGIQRAQMESLEAKLRAAGFDVARSLRTEAVSGSFVGHGDGASAALAERVRAMAQDHFSALGCQLDHPPQLRLQPGPGLPTGQLLLSVDGRCPP